MIEPDPAYGCPHPALYGRSSSGYGPGMRRSVRKLLLTLHVSISVGWLGAAVAYIALAITGIMSVEAAEARSAYASLELVAWFVIVPLAAGSLLTGSVQSLATEWGLFRHYWISAKLLLTCVATLVLLGHMPAVSRMSAMAASSTSTLTEAAMLPAQLVLHAAGGIVVLLVVVTLSVFKPWGRTPWGRRLLRARDSATG